MKAEMIFRVGLTFSLTISFFIITLIKVDKLLQMETSTATTVLKNMPQWPLVSICTITRATESSGGFLDLVHDRIRPDELIFSITSSYNWGKNLTSVDSVTKEHYWLREDSDQKELLSCFTFEVHQQRRDEGENLKIIMWTNRTVGKTQFLTFSQAATFLGPFASLRGDHGIYRENASDRARIYEFSIALREDLNTPENPCIMEPTKTPLDCFEDFLAQNSPCVPIWWTEKMMTNAKNGKVCSSEEDYESFKNVSESLVRGQSLKKFLSLTGCETSCRTEKLTVREVHEEVNENPSQTFLGLTGQQKDIKLEREIYIYDKTDFLADVGGFLGLLLGVSALSIYDALIAMMEKAFKRKNTQVLSKQTENN